MRQTIGWLLRILVPVLLLSWIVWKVADREPDLLRQVYRAEKDWPRLVLALLVFLCGVVGTFLRWYLLVRALHLPIRMSAAMRLGFVGYFFQFFSLGAVGGDFFKALFVVREHDQRRLEAVGSIVVDRVVGLESMLILGSTAFWLYGLGNLAPALRSLAFTCMAGAALGLATMSAALWTSWSLAGVKHWLRRYPRVAGMVARVDDALHLYRRHRISFIIALLSGLLTHGLQAFALYLAATAIFPSSASYLDQLVIWSIAGAAGAIPLAPGGLGTFEAAYCYLYDAIPASATTFEEGVIITIVYRILTVIVAGMGVFIYWTHRREMNRALKEASAEEEFPETMRDSS